MSGEFRALLRVSLSPSVQISQGADRSMCKRTGKWVWVALGQAGCVGVQFAREKTPCLPVPWRGSPPLPPMPAFWKRNSSKEMSWSCSVQCAYDLFRKMFTNIYMLYVYVLLSFTNVAKKSRKAIVRVGVRPADCCASHVWRHECGGTPAVRLHRDVWHGLPLLLAEVFVCLCTPALHVV